MKSHRQQSMPWTDVRCFSARDNHLYTIKILGHTHIRHVFCVSSSTSSEEFWQILFLIFFFVAKLYEDPFFTEEEAQISIILCTLFYTINTTKTIILLQKNRRDPPRVFVTSTSFRKFRASKRDQRHHTTSLDQVFASTAAQSRPELASPRAVTNTSSLHTICRHSVQLQCQYMICFFECILKLSFNRTVFFLNIIQIFNKL